jgi:glycerol uptake facilitator-like aquaporin
MSDASFSVGRRWVAECLGTALLLSAVVGSGIMGESLAGGNVAIALLANTIATFNPAVTLAEAMRGALAWRDVPGYVAAQLSGAVLGVAVAHLMFEHPLFTASLHERSGGAQAFSEFVATFGLLAVIIACVRHRPTSVPYAVGSYITAAYWFTASTSFANPAVTLARAATNTFSGIRPIDAPAFVLAQLCGAVAAVGIFRWLLPVPPVAKGAAPTSAPVAARGAE